MTSHNKSVAALPMLVAMVAALSSCRQPAGLDAAVVAPADAAVSVSAAPRKAVATNFTVDAMTMETRLFVSAPYVDYADGVTTWKPGMAPVGLAAVSTFNALPRTAAGYTNRPVSLAKLDCAVVIPGDRTINLGDPTTPDDDFYGSADTYRDCLRNPGDGTTAEHNDLATRFRARVTATANTKLAVRFGVDFAGAVLLVDGAVVSENWDDPFWGTSDGNYFDIENGTYNAKTGVYTPIWETNTLSVLTASFRMNAGTTHIIELIGFENGADQGSAAQFNDGGGWVNALTKVPPYTAAVTVSVGAGGGRVTSNPAGVDCGTTCTANFGWGTMPLFTPIADGPWFKFTGWSGACTGVTPCEPLVEAPKSVTATFTRANWKFTVGVAGSGTVSTATAPSNAEGEITCVSPAAECWKPFAVGSSVTLTPTPAAGWTFVGWSDGCSGNGACVVPMTQDRKVTATFVLTSSLKTLTVTKVNDGVVSSQPDGLTCSGSICTGQFAPNAEVKLVATGGTGTTFSNWSAACAGSVATCTVTMTNDVAVTAMFTPKPSDSVAPVVSCKADPDYLWSPDHKLRPINVSVTLNEPGTFKLLSVLSNEPPNTTGDGSTSVDIVDWALGTADTLGSLRAERRGDAKDRIYTLTYQGTDLAGNYSAISSCTVTVPHDQKKDR